MAFQLDAAQQAAVNLALRNCAEARELCEKGTACGFDMSGQYATNEALSARLAAVKANFGPGGKSNA